MRIFFDTEFIEDGKTIDLISIGLVRADGAELYLESAECDLSKASAWVVENVFPSLGGVTTCRAEMARQIRLFCGDEPEFWAYYADYDWIALCQLFGRMIDLPSGWPMYCRDIKQEADRRSVQLPKQPSGEHNALSDARWNKMRFDFLMAGT